MPPPREEEGEEGNDEEFQARKVERKQGKATTTRSFAKTIKTARQGADANTSPAQTLARVHGEDEDQAFASSSVLGRRMLIGRDAIAAEYEDYSSEEDEESWMLVRVKKNRSPE